MSEEKKRARRHHQTAPKDATEVKRGDRIKVHDVWWEVVRIFPLGCEVVRNRALSWVRFTDPPPQHHHSIPGPNDLRVNDTIMNIGTVTAVDENHFTTRARDGGTHRWCFPGCNCQLDPLKCVVQPPTKSGVSYVAEKVYADPKHPPKRIRLHHRYSHDQMVQGPLTIQGAPRGYTASYSFRMDPPSKLLPAVEMLTLILQDEPILATGPDGQMVALGAGRFEYGITVGFTTIRKDGKDVPAQVQTWRVRRVKEKTSGKRKRGGARRRARA